MATLDQTLLKVQRLLTGPMGLRVDLDGNGFLVRFQDASTAVRLQVRDWGTDREGESRTLVLISALILRGVQPTPQLFEWVARQGGSRWFGHVEVHDDRDNPGTVYLLLSHTLLGDFLDEKELETAMYAVLGGADSWDEELQKQFGGKRWSDA
ncbi:MAG: hypothetical protein AB7R55_24005 [Gemmatimonadales bacterium]